MWYITICIFILSSVVPVACKWLHVEWYGGWKFPMDTAILYVVLGYLLSTVDLNRKNRIIVYALGISGALIRYLYTYFASISLNDVNRDLFSYDYFPAVFLSIAVFVFFKNCSWNKVRNSVWGNYIVKAASCSFGIYLIHITVMEFEQNILRFPQGVWWRSIGIIFTYIIALLAVSVMKKMPIVKYIVP